MDLKHKSNSLWKLKLFKSCKIVEICIEYETSSDPVGILSQETFNRIARLVLHGKID